MAVLRKEVKIDQMVDIQTVACALGVHENTVYKLIREKKIEAFRITKQSLRISESSVTRYLEECKVHVDQDLNGSRCLENDV